MRFKMRLVSLLSILLTPAFAEQSSRIKVHVVCLECNNGKTNDLQLVAEELSSYSEDKKFLFDVTLIAPALFSQDYNLKNTAKISAETLTPEVIAQIVDSTDVVFVSSDPLEIKVFTQAGVSVITMHGIMAEPEFSFYNNLPSQSSYALPYYAAIPRTNKQLMPCYLNTIISRITSLLYQVPRIWTPYSTSYAFYIGHGIEGILEKT
jgi:hypothetical protein